MRTRDIDLVVLIIPPINSAGIHREALGVNSHGKEPATLAMRSSLNEPIYEKPLLQVGIKS